MGRSASDTEADENAVHTGEDLRKWEKPSELEGKRLRRAHRHARFQMSQQSLLLLLLTAQKNWHHVKKDGHVYTTNYGGKVAAATSQLLDISQEFYPTLIYSFLLLRLYAAKGGLSLSLSRGGKGGYSLDPHSHRSPLSIEKPTHII